MNKLNRMVVMASLAAGLFLGTSSAFAQGPGGGRNFDPEQMRQRQMDRYKELMGVTEDAEWKVIQERVEKVMTAQRESQASRFAGMFGGGGGGGRRGGGDGDNNNNNNNNAGDNQGARRGGGRGGFGAPSPEREALQKAIDSKASAEEIKTKLAKLREVQKEKDAKLEKAQDDLKKVLSARQEAGAVLAGLLK